MDLELSWLLLGLPLAFVLGWAASRFDLRQLRFDSRQAPKAYFKGLNYLLNEQQDKAIDAFIEAVQNDPDTSELHFALGNLFRRRGEYQRAVRVHEHLLSRGDLAAADREQAQHALALDFLKAGVLDRAEDALKKLDGSALEPQALAALLAIQERSREWAQAADTARRLEAAGQPGDFRGRLAHYLCEQAAALPAGDEAGARTLLERAIATVPAAPRPRIDLAQRQRACGEHEAAFATLDALFDAAAPAVALIAAPFAELAGMTGRQRQALERLQASYAASPSLDVLDAVIALEQQQQLSTTQPAPSDAAPRDRYVAHLERSPSLVAATRWLAGEKLEHEQFHAPLQRALERAARPLTRYRCASCGFETSTHFWQCPGCQNWDSFPPRRIDEL